MNAAIDSQGVGTTSSAENKPTRRYGSACDSCRRRRVRCDGKQPCERCHRSGVLCTYGSTSKRVSAASYAKQLEQKVAELQQLLHQQPSVESATSAEEMTTVSDAVRQKVVDMLIGPGDDFVYRLPESDTNVFYGRFGGFGTMHTIGTHSVRLAPNPSMKHFSRVIMETFDTLSLSPASPSTTQVLAMLPPKTLVQSLSERAIKTVLLCHDCFDAQDYTQHLDYIYNTDPQDYTNADRSFLSLVYAMIALGKRFAPMTHEDELDEHSEKIKLKGLAYFHASCNAFSVAEAGDLNAIRAIICQARYLGSMSMISKAYSQVSIGITIAMRLGMHVSSRAVEAVFSYQELFERRKVFATLNMMDVYLSSILGLPVILKDADASQTLGLQQIDLEDEGRAFIMRHFNSTLAPTIMSQKINQIMARISSSRYLPDQSLLDVNEDHYTEDVEQVTAREEEIKEWYECLPPLPEDTSDVTQLQSHLTLQIWYTLVQIVLYRPFLHHLAKSSEGQDVNLSGFTLASKCVQAAMQAILTVEVFHVYGILHEGNWTCIYMLEYAVSILLYLISSSPDSATIKESKIAVRKAGDLLGFLAKYNLLARKCFISLNSLLETLSSRAAAPET